MLETLGNLFSHPLFRREGRQPTETQGDFRIDGWEYGSRENVVQLCERVAKRTRCSAKDLLKAFDTGGGKALGLKLCELIADRCRDVKVEVPRWKILTAQEVAQLPREEEALLTVMNKLGFEYPILRSSDQKEDFLSAAAGTHASHVLRKRPGQVNLPSIPHIVQRDCIGFGVVVNVAKSRILKGKTVVKASSGRFVFDPIGHTSFTSATNDTEASTVVLDPMDGNVLLKQQSFGHLTALDNPHINFGALASNIRAATTAIGIDFGVEFEFIFEPDNGKISLVQVRPLPAKMRPESFLGQATSELDQEEGRLLLRSSIVSGPFYVHGPVRVMRSRQQQDDLLGWKGLDFRKLLVESRNIDQILKLAEESHRRSAGQISFHVVDQTNRRAKGDMNDPSNFPLALLADYATGASFVLKQGPIEPNTNHASVVKALPAPIQKIKDFLRAHLPMMSITPEQSLEVQQALRNESAANLVSRSDGIIGEVRLLAAKE